MLDRFRSYFDRQEKHRDKTTFQLEEDEFVKKYNLMSHDCAALITQH